MCGKGLELLRADVHFVALYCNSRRPKPRSRPNVVEYRVDISVITKFAMNPTSHRRWQLEQRRQKLVADDGEVVSQAIPRHWPSADTRAEGLSVPQGW
jgi:hypothetical protein